MDGFASLVSSDGGRRRFDTNVVNGVGARLGAKGVPALFDGYYEHGYHWATGWSGPDGSVAESSRRWRF
jgi:hypothetical protein